MHHKNCWYRSVCSQAPQECSPTCIRYAEMLNLLQLSNLPEKRWCPVGLVPGKDRKAFLRLAEIKLNIQEHIANGSNLYLYSQSFGNGKTSWAIKLMLSYFDKIWAGNCFRRRGVFVAVPEFLDRNRQEISRPDNFYVQLREDMLTCDLVIWDDVSSIKLTDYGHSMFLNYLDARVLNEKANIFTGNVDQQQMYGLLGGRLTSRIWNTSEVIQFVDQDKRGIEYEKNQDKRKELI